MSYSGLAFYPLTLPLTTGPRTIAVMISLGLSRSAYSDYTQDLGFFLASLLATIVMAAAIYICFAYSDRVERLLGGSGTDIAARASRIHPFLSRHSNYLDRGKRSSGERATARNSSKVNCSLLEPRWKWFGYAVVIDVALTALTQSLMDDSGDDPKSYDQDTASILRDDLVLVSISCPTDCCTSGVLTVRRRNRVANPAGSPARVPKASRSRGDDHWRSRHYFGAWFFADLEISKVVRWLTDNADRLQLLYVQAADWLDGHSISVTDMVITGAPAIRTGFFLR